MSHLAAFKRAPDEPAETAGRGARSNLRRILSAYSIISPFIA